MPRPPWKVLAPLAGLVLLVQFAHLPGEAFFRERMTGGGGNVASSLGVAGFVRIALVALVGRILLAWLPAGLPGSHHPRDGLVTWATSHLLGLLALVAERGLLREASDALLLAPWLVLLVLRLATSPAAMVPRHEPLHERGGRPAQLLRWIAVFCALAWVFAPDVLPRPVDLYATSADAVLGRGLPLTSLGWIALWILIDHALEGARRAPVGRAVALLVLATPTAPFLFANPAALGLGLGAVFLVPWVRRAERRACALAALGFASLLLFGRPLPALAGLATLVLVSTRVQRPRAATTALASAALAWAATGFETFALAERPRFDLDPRGLWTGLADLDRWGVVWIACLPTLLWALAAFRPVRGPREPEAIDDVERELRALLVLFLLLALALLPGPSDAALLDSLVDLFPCVVLIGGLTWIRTERVAPGG